MDTATRNAIITKTLMKERCGVIRDKLRILLVDRQVPFISSTVTTERQKPLGVGQYGIVELIRYQGKLYAQKRPRENRNEHRLGILEEAIKMTDIALHHPNIQRLHFINLKTCGLLIDYCGNGSLDEVVKNEKSNYTLVDALNWAYQLADALSFLHSKNMMHRDVKMQNILLKDNYQTLVLTDYGTATQLGRSLMTNQVGTPITMAPEVIRGTDYTEQCDTYSWAIVFWQLLSKQLLPYGDQGIGFLINIVRDNRRPPEFSNCPKLFMALMYRSWHSDPNERPTLSFIKKTLQLVLNRLPKKKQEYTEEMIYDLKKQWLNEHVLPEQYLPHDPRWNNEQSINVHQDHLIMMKRVLNIKHKISELKQKQAKCDRYDELLDRNEQLQKQIDELRKKMSSKDI